MYTSYNVYTTSTTLINFNVLFENLRILKIQIIKKYATTKTIQYN